MSAVERWENHLSQQGAEGTVVDGVSGTSRCFLPEPVQQVGRSILSLSVLEIQCSCPSLLPGRTGLSKPPCCKNGGMASSQG